MCAFTSCVIYLRHFVNHPRANPGFRSEPPAAKGPGCAYMHPIFRVIQWSLRSSMAPLRVSFSRFCTAPTGLSGGGVCSTATVHRPASCWPMHCTQCCTLQARGLLKPGTRRWPAQPLVYRCTQTADAAGLDQHCSAVERCAMEPCVHGSSEGHAGHSSVAVAKYCATAVAVTLNTTVSVRMLLNARLYPV